MPLGYCSKQMQTISPHTWWTYLYLLTSPIYLVFSSQYLPSSNVTQGEDSSSMIHYAQYCLHNLSLVSLHGVTLSHLLKDQCSHLQMPCSMKDSSDPLVMFVYSTWNHWLCNILVGCSLLESVIDPHQSAILSIPPLIPAGFWLESRNSGAFWPEYTGIRLK